MKVAEVADEYLRRRAALDPETAEALGADHPLLIGDLSPETFAERARLDRETSAALTDPDPADDRVLAEAMRERLDSDADLYDIGFTTSLAAPLATPVHRLRQVFDDLPRCTEAEWARVADHLEAVPAALNQYAATLQWSVKAGHRQNLRQVTGLAAQVRSWADPAGANFYPSIAGEYAGSDTLGSRLTAAAGAAESALSTFADFLTGDLAAQATAPDAVGREWYETTSRAFLGAAVDLDELLDYGWSELRRLDAEVRALAASITGAADLPTALAMLDADPARRIATGEPLRAWLQGRLDGIGEFLNGTHFDIPAATAPVEARMVTASSGVMYYAPADAALTRPGRVWWTVPAGETSVPTWRQMSTVHHEGLPGHHLQFAITLGLNGLHPWQRYLCHVHGYAEGWAHYSETLAQELGLLDDPADLLGALYAQIWRAARIVIDIGLHVKPEIPAGNGFTTAERWTPEVAVDFLHEVAGVDRQTAGFEVDRYLGWPGQALAFKVGARLWQQTRTEVEAMQGNAFDLKTFHMTALGLGPMGLGPLASTLRRLSEPVAGAL